MANSSDSSNSNHSTRTMLNSGALSSVHQPMRIGVYASNSKSSYMPGRDCVFFLSLCHHDLKPCRCRPLPNFSF